jgi:hypothetical protein
VDLPMSESLGEEVVIETGALASICIRTTKKATSTDLVPDRQPHLLSSAMIGCEQKAYGSSLPGLVRCW